MSHRWRVPLVMTLCLVLALVAHPLTAQRSSLADLRIHFGEYGPQWDVIGADVEAGTGERGGWTVEPARDGDRLRLRVTISPSPVNPVLGPATASLVTGVGVDFGRRDRGDIGYSHGLGFTWTPVDGCTGDPCAYQADVTVRLRPAQRFIASTPAIESPVVVIGFSLVRTFGDGGWLQVSKALDLANGRQDAPVSGLIAIAGWVPRAAVIPTGSAQIWGIKDAPNIGADEVSRLLGGERPSTPPVPTSTVRLHVRTTGCVAEQGVQLQDDWGTVPLAGSVATIGPAGTVVALPDPTVWSLYVAGTRIVGEVDTAGVEQVVEATVACRINADDERIGAHGRLTAVLAPEPLPDPPPDSTWLVSVESHRVDMPPRAALAVAAADGFLVVERQHPRGWTVARSADGLRWATVRGARLPAALSTDDVDGPRLASDGDRVVLAGIADGGQGGPRFGAWSTTDGRRWTAAVVPNADGQPDAASLALRSLVATDDLWFALADGDGSMGAHGWTSPDGRRWSAVVPRPPEATSLIAVGAGQARLLGVARPHDPGRPDLLVSSSDGREWTELAPLPVQRAERVSVGETSTGTVVATFGRSAVAPIEAHVSADDGSTWTKTLDGSVGLRLDDVTVRDQTVVVTGSVRYGERGLESSPWVALSQDAGTTWRAEMPFNGYGDGRCATAAAIGLESAVLTVDGCSGNPAPRWRVALEPPTGNDLSDG